MNKIRGAQKSSAIIGEVEMAVAIPQKSKTTGGASPVVLEVYHEVEAGLPEGQLPSNDWAGYLR
jgi:hypothetical protein